MPAPLHAQEAVLPAPGSMVRLSLASNPAVLKGIKVHPDDPFQFEFILDKGDSALTGQALKDESTRLIKYFLASLTVPEGDLWVNLSPYEKDRIVPEGFGQTEMGRDLLAQDYILKQVTASLIYPEDELGKKFWARIYKEAAQKFGTTDIPVNTFNKVWIVPQKAVVYENAPAGTAYVAESKLKVMLEEDYLSLNKHKETPTAPTKSGQNAGASQVIREVILPELEREVNEGGNFAQVRQAYNSLILAAWYKKKIKDSILNRVYADRNKISGVNIDDPQEKQKIYERYLQAFKKGAYNYIKEEQDPVTRSMVPRKYFAGGLNLSMDVLDVRQMQGPLPVSPGGDMAMVSVRVSPWKTVLYSSLLALAIFTESGAQLKAFSPQALELIKVQDTRERLQVPENLDQKVTAQLNQVFADYINKNYKAFGRAITPAERSAYPLPYLDQFLTEQNVVLAGQAAPYNVLTQALKKHFADLKRRKATLSADELGKWAGLQENALGFIHVAMLEGSWYSEGARSIQGLIFGAQGKRIFNCDAISMLTLLIAQDWGLEGVAWVEVFESQDGKKYPDARGIGHVINGMVDVLGRKVFRDQRGKTLPRKAGPFLLLSDLVSQKKVEVLFDQLAPNRRFSMETFERPGELGRFSRILSQIAAYPKVLANNDVLRQNFEMAKRYKNMGDYNAAFNKVESDFEAARLLFKPGTYRQAADAYDAVARQVPALRQRFKGLPGISQALIDQLSDVERTSLENKEAALHNTGVVVGIPQGGNVVVVRPPAASSTSAFGEYQAARQRIFALDTEAQRLFKAGDFNKAILKFKGLKDYINGQIPALREKLKNITGVVDSQGRPLSGNDLVAELQGHAWTAESNELASLFNTYTGGSDAAVVRQKMTEIINRVTAILRANPRMPAGIKAKFDELLRISRQRNGDRAMLGEPGTGQDSAMFSLAQGGVSISLDEGLAQYQGLAKRVADIVNYVLEHDSLPAGVTWSGRSIIVPLSQDEQFTVNGKTFKALRLKGATYQGGAPKMEAYTADDDAVGQPTHLLEAQKMDGRQIINYREKSPSVQGTIFLSTVQDEYEKTKAIFEAGVPTAMPLGLGEFTGMDFNGKKVGFLVLAEENDPVPLRLGAELRKQLQQKRTQTYYADLGKGVLGAARLLRQLNTHGFSHFSPHLAQFGGRNIYDFSDAYSISRDGLSREEFIYRVIVGFAGLYESVDGFVRLNNMPLEFVLRSQEARRAYQNILEGYFTAEEIADIKKMNEEDMNPAKLSAAVAVVLSMGRTRGRALADVITEVTNKNVVMAELAQAAGAVYDAPKPADDQAMTTVISRQDLMDLASAEAEVRRAAAKRIPLVPGDKLKKAEALIDNFIDPVGIAEAETAARAKFGDKFDRWRLVRNARIASLFSLAYLIRFHVGSEELMRYLADRIDREAPLWRKDNLTRIESMRKDENNSVSSGTKKEIQWIKDTQLGGDAKDIPSEYAFVQLMRSINLTKQLNSRGETNIQMLDWAYDSIELILTGGVRARPGSEATRVVEAKSADQAMTSPGGIDLNSGKMDLKVQNEGGEIQFNIDPLMMQQLQNAPGFVPVIINIQPLIDLPLFLGVQARDNSSTTT